MNGFVFHAVDCLTLRFLLRKSCARKLSTSYAKDNKCLGVFKLSGLKPAPQGETKIQVIFDVDANGILSVKAIDEYTGKEQSIIISDASRLEASEIEQITKNTSKETNKFNHTAALEPLVGSELLNKIE